MTRSTLSSSLVCAALLFPASVAAGMDSPCDCRIVAPFDHFSAVSNADEAAGGGLISIRPSKNSATINGAGRIAFMASISGPPRDEGIFVADESGLTPIAIGCDSGCGDPSPIGGTFRRFYDHEYLAPPINDRGDVLFIADLNGGGAPRGLFLHQGDTGVIVKVAAVGDLSPLGGTLIAVGCGSLNNSRDVVFLAKNSGTDDVNILRWSAGTLTKVAAVDDPAPGGGTFVHFGNEEIFAHDLTRIPAGAPGLNDAGDISFRATVVDGTAFDIRLIVSTGGTMQIIAKQGDPAPGGGMHDLLGYPIINNRGDVAFFSTVVPDSGPITASWFRGLPGNLDRAMSFHDPVDGGEVFGMGFSRNPFHALDDCGNLALWANIKYPDATERDATIICHADGQLVVIAREGDPTGREDDTYTSMFYFPSMNNARQIVVSAGDSASSELPRYSHFVFTGSQPSPIDGSVNSATGPVTNVLFVNGEAGDVVVATETPFTISLDAAPTGPASGKYFFYVWATSSLNPVDLIARGTYLGCFSNPTPFQRGESPMPYRCVRGMGVPPAVCRGLSEHAGPRTAPFSIPISGGFKHPVTLRLQGVLQDAGAGNVLGYSVTNSVGLEVR